MKENLYSEIVSYLKNSKIIKYFIKFLLKLEKIIKHILEVDYW